MCRCWPRLLAKNHFVVDRDAGARRLAVEHHDAVNGAVRSANADGFVSGECRPQSSATPIEGELQQRHSIERAGAECRQRGRKRCGGRRVGNHRDRRERRSGSAGAEGRQALQSDAQRIVGRSGIRADLQLLEIGSQAGVRAGGFQIRQQSIGIRAGMVFCCEDAAYMKGMMFSDVCVSAGVFVDGVFLNKAEGHHFVRRNTLECLSLCGPASLSVSGLEAVFTEDHDFRGGDLLARFLRGPTPRLATVAAVGARQGQDRMCDAVRVSLEARIFAVLEQFCHVRICLSYSLPRK
jgi:hypothetical protein